MQQINDGKFGVGAIKCGAEGCEESLEELLIRHCIGEEEFEKYLNYQSKNLVCEGLVIRQCNGYIYKTGEHLVEIKAGLSKKDYEALQD